MAGDLRYIAETFSDDVISFCVGKMNVEERLTFMDSMKKIREELDSTVDKDDKKKKKVRKNKATKKPSAEELFRNDILPLLERKLDEYNAKLSDAGEGVSAELNFDTNFSHMSLEEKIETHKQMMFFESKLEFLRNVEKHFRGKLYVSLRKDMNGQKIGDFYRNTLGLTYATVQKLINFYALTKNYPMLIACLSYEQIQSHGKRLFDYLNQAGRKLGERLEIDLGLVNNGRDYNINRKDVPIVAENLKVDAVTESSDRCSDANNEGDDISQDLENTLLESDDDYELSSTLSF